MSEIKPVYQVQQLGEWIEVDKNIFDELYIQNKFPHRILYPAAAYEALQKEVTHWKANHADLKERLHAATHRTDLPSDRLPLFDKMKAEIAALQKENERLDFKFKHYCGRIRKVLQRHRERDAAQSKRIEHLEYKIDELMLEWCPDEMTPEQLENYAKHQRKVSL